MMPMRPIAERFWKKVRVDGECWIWTAGRYWTGYGRIGRGGKGAPDIAAHRVAWEMLRGPIPDGLVLDHYRLNPGPLSGTCSKACVNPDHLRVTTLKENLLAGPGPAAANAKKTHCIHGHEFTDNNTYVRSLNGRRSCRTCVLAACRLAWPARSARTKARERAKTTLAVGHDLARG